MRVKTPVFPIWMTSLPYPSPGPADLTRFPLELPLATFARAFWGTLRWRFQGTLTYRTSDGVSWSSWQNYAFDFELKTFPEDYYAGNEQLMVSNPVASSLSRFNGSSVEATPSFANLIWENPFAPTPSEPHVYWSGNHGEEAGLVTPGFYFWGSFNATLLGTALSVDFHTYDDQAGYLNQSFSALTILGTTISFYMNSESDVTIAGATEVGSLSASVEPSLFLEYRNTDGTAPVWDSLTGTQLIDPRTT